MFSVKGRGFVSEAGVQHTKTRTPGYVTSDSSLLTTAWHCAPPVAYAWLTDSLYNCRAVPACCLLICVCRLSFGMSGDGEVAMKVVSRGDSEAVSEMVHAIIQEA